MKKPSRKKLIKINKLKKRAEAVFHKFIVLRDKNTCFTCGNTGNQAGHFCHSRLDFDEINLNCQCVRCNHFLSGNLGRYAIFLDKVYGAGTAEALILRSHTQSNKFSRDELNEIIEKYGLLIKELVK
jgi:hypothetical protein